jgi:pimeloyl-ACP methyl ester carboxylesterase
MKLFYRETGCGPPLIILHGLFGMSDNWMSLAKRFGESHKVYLLDMRNHGQSPHHHCFDYNCLTSDLQKFINERKLSQVTLLGHSMGGKIAMNFSLNYSEMVDKLIIVDIAAKAYDTSRFKSILQTMQALPLDKISSRKEAENILSIKIKHKGLRQFLLKNITRDKKNNFIWKLNVNTLLANIDNISQKIDSNTSFPKPTLLIYGGRSDYVNADDIKNLQQLFPALQTRVIPNTTHWLHAEAPEEFHKIVMEFL